MGCLLTYPINVPVRVAIKSPESPLFRRDPATFNAVVVSGGSDKLTFRWGHFAGVCPAVSNTAGRTDEGDGSASFALSPEPNELGPLCVWLEARDEHGAQAFAQTNVVVHDRPVVVQIVQISQNPTTTVPLGTRVVVSVEAVDPDDDVVPPFAVVLRRPDGMDASFLQCEAPFANAPQLKCFDVTTPGTWTVGVSGEFVPMTTPGLEVKAAEDQPPCLSAIPGSATLFHDTSQVLKLEISVRDDLDASPSARPGSMTRFRWSVAERPGAAFLAAVDYTERSFSLVDGRYGIGDELRVRVDVADRVERQSACKPSDDICGTATCSQRMTWKVQFQ